MAPNVCRICMKQNNPLLDIFGESGLAAKISSCFTVKIRSRDDITTKICESCYTLTMSTYARQLQVRKNNTELWKQCTTKTETKKRKTELKHNKVHASVKKLKLYYPKIKIPKKIQNSNLLPLVVCDKVVEIERLSNKSRESFPNGISYGRITTDDALSPTNFDNNDKSSASSTIVADVFKMIHSMEPTLTEYSLESDGSSFQSPISTNTDFDDDVSSAESINYEHLIRPNAIVLLEKLDHLNTKGITSFDSLPNDSSLDVTLNCQNHSITDQTMNVLPDLVLETTNKGMPQRNSEKELFHFEFTPLSELVDNMDGFNYL